MASTSVARAAVNPVGLGLGVVGVLAGLLAGSLALGLVVGVVLWLAVSVVTLLRRAAAPPTAGGRGRRKDVDPFTLGEPWRFFVRDALQAQERFRDVVSRAPAGPTRERLTEIGQRLDEGVDQVWATAQRGNTLRQARTRIDVPTLQRRLDDARASIDAAVAADPLHADDLADRTVASLQGQLDSAGRLDQVTAQAEKRLTLLQAQLDESVTRAAELSASVGDTAALAGVGTDIEHLVEEMEALRLALDETGGLTLGPGTSQS
jgi:hypothetical protein